MLRVFIRRRSSKIKVGVGEPMGLVRVVTDLD
jgi:hypothetical protein